MTESIKNNNDDKEVEFDDVCPNCLNNYSDEDYESQICHVCGYNNNN